MLTALATTLFLFCFTPPAFGQGSGATQDEPVEQQALVMFETDAVALPRPNIQRLLDAIMPAQVQAVLSSANTEEITKGFPDFRRADTVRVLSDGRVYRVPDYTNLFVLTVPPSANRDSLVARLERLSEVVYAEKNQRVVPLRSIVSEAHSKEKRSRATTRSGKVAANEVIPPNQ